MILSDHPAAVNSDPRWIYRARRYWGVSCRYGWDRWALLSHRPGCARA